MSEETSSLSLANDPENDLTMTFEETTEEGKSASSKLQEELGLAPKTIVLAKVKGYRAWPAMVLAEGILPENIKKLKPKSVKQQKKTQPTILVPVRFFSDDTYIWIRNHDLKILLKDDIQLFLDKHATLGKKKDELLVFAYELANNPPDMEQFNLWGSRGPPEFTESSELAEEPPRKKLKLKISLKGLKEKGSAKSKAEASKASKSKSKAKASSAKSSSKTTKKAAPKVERYASYEEFERDLERENFDDPGDDEYGSDWGIDGEVYDFSTGDFVFEDEKEQESFVNEFPSASELQKNSAYYIDQFDSIFRKVAPCLLDSDLTKESQVVKELRAAAKIAREAPFIVFTKSPLFRSLLVAAHKPYENLPSENIKKAVNSLLKEFSVDACTLTAEDLILPTPLETPNQTPGLTPGPENGIKEEAAEEPAKTEEAEEVKTKIEEGENVAPEVAANGEA